ncbi:MAG TPA: M23 family metallopeptidase [Steroidobacteraceae bacterium]|nr:M23 family metallopeptidase [Steroidobacteraceae bacterium]
MRELSRGAWAELIALALALSSATLPAQTAYKYRDSSGQWVFTDQAPAAAARSDSFSVGHENDALHLSVDRSDAGGSTQLIAVNDCLCVVTFEIAIQQSDIAAIPNGTGYRATLPPGTRQIMAQADTGSTKAGLRYVWRAALGSPDAVHKPSRPYRVPFDVGSSYVVSQAYPSQITHTTPDSQYAVDIALPDGTPVYAAREGTVINARHDFFRGATAPVMFDQANVIEILHDDGTIGLYAHLRWDSIRVRIGAHVARGQYIADSGNTGFSSGPHLHFAVIRNAGTADVSVPIQFAGIADTGVTPETQMPLTSY